VDGEFAGPPAFVEPPEPVDDGLLLHAAGIGFHQGAQPGNIVDSPQIQVKVQQCQSALHQNFSGYYA